MDPALEYQRDYSKSHGKTMFDAARRAGKARKTVAVLNAWAQPRGLDLRHLRLLDIGCSAGHMTTAYADAFGDVVGIDIDTGAVEFARGQHRKPNLIFEQRDSMDTGYPEGSLDVVTCTHIYEHVPDAHRLMDEIYRVLKPGGVCYFAAGNRLIWLERHYRLPLLSVVPKPLAHRMLRLLGRGDHYYEKHLTYWSLKKLVARFELTDYTLEVVRNPAKYHGEEMVTPGSAKQRLALAIVPLIYWLCPSYIWLLRKPGELTVAAAGSETLGTSGRPGSL
jgi:2-polyprenyl-3-methyl-5-hydroxy-6-metoxy-1,4-benzoquinol methylase